jgi:hypothetical protein
VVAKQQPLRQAPNARFPGVGKASDRQQHLILLRLESYRLGGIIAASQELANAKAQLGQGRVVGVANLSTHPFSIS